MKQVHAEGEVVFRPSNTRASLPLAATAVAAPVLTARLVAVNVIEWWTVATAMAGSLIVFGTSFLMPFLRSVRVRPGAISGPMAYGVHTLRLEDLDLPRCRLDEAGQAWLVDRVGSELHLTLMDLRPEEIYEALVIFGLDPDELWRVDVRA